METETRYRSMTERMKGAALLQVDVYEEVEHDVTATSQAAGVVAIRQALDVSTGKAVVTALLGWLSYVVVGLLLTVLFGLPMLGA